MAYKNPTPKVLEIAEHPEAQKTGQDQSKDLSFLDDVDVKDAIIFFPSWCKALKGKATLQDIAVLCEIIHPFWESEGSRLTGFDFESAKKDVIDLSTVVDRAWVLGVNENQAKKALFALVKNELLEPLKVGQREAVDMLRGKSPQHVQGKGKTCAWCKGTAYLLQSHHYPIPKSQGGINVVQICPSCHYEYHHLVSKSFYKLTDKAMEMIEQEVGKV